MFTHCSFEESERTPKERIFAEGATTHVIRVHFDDARGEGCYYYGAEALVLW